MTGWVGKTRASAVAGAGTILVLTLACRPVDRAADGERVLEVAAGAELRARLESAVTPATRRPGSPLTLTVVSPVLSEGETAIPADSRIAGRVTASEISEVSEVSAGRFGLTRLKLAFDRLGVREDVYPLRAEVVRVETTPRSGSRYIGGVAWRADQVARDAQTALATALGSGVAFESRDSVIVPAGSVFTLRVTESLRIDGGGQ